MKGIDICYEKDPHQPILLPILRINANQFTYHMYSTSDTQIVRLLNELYVPFDPYNEEVYEQRDVTMKDILSLLWKYTDKFDGKTINSFTSWCSKSKFPFMQVESSRKSLKNNDMERIRYRRLYVVKDEFMKFQSLKVILDDIANGIREDIPKYQQYVNNLKSNGYEVIGYVRKSYGNEDKDTRIRLLQSIS
ncbi:hypothetical protein EDC94DRAFT_581775 [Helicostylum pulchrum]|nr:hypothetical protein EDC94DRAFT_581775 [Helicostylum pulchrum]